MCSVGLECGARLLFWTVREAYGLRTAHGPSSQQAHVLVLDVSSSPVVLGSKAKQRNAGSDWIGWQRGHVLDTFPFGHSQSIPNHLLGAPVTTTACPNGAAECS